MKRVGWTYLFPVLLLLAVTLPHLDQGDFRTDTARYAAVGLQAWRDPALFWTPHLHPAVPYLNKPPLAFWIHGLVLHCLGVGLVAARLPSILAAAGCVLLTVAIARRLLGRSTALAAGIVLALTYEFFRRTREISLDMWHLCFMLAAVWLVVRAARRRHTLGFCLAGIPLGLALMTKPLMALLVVPVLALWTRRWRGPLLMLVAALAIALPWHLSMAWLHGQAFVAQYFGHEIVGRAMGELNWEPPWYYAAEIGRTYWPWMLLIPTGVWYSARAGPRRRAGLTLAGFWLAAWGIALTIFPDKRPRYELPLYPALAMIGGYGWAHLPWRRLRYWYKQRLPAVAAAVAACALLLAYLPVRLQAPPDPHLTALMRWALSNPAQPVYAAAFSTNDEGYYYLQTARWPSPVRTRDQPAAGIPRDACLIYTAGLEPKPGENETIVFRSGPYAVTRLGDGGWQAR